jgi:hypothetical protein
MLEIVKDWGVFQDKKKLNGARHRQNPRGKSVSVCLTPDTGRFQQDYNLKHKAKYTLELLTKKIVNVPDWPGYIFDLNILENIWQDLKTNLTELKEF